MFVQKGVGRGSLFAFVALSFLMLTATVAQAESSYVEGSATEFNDAGEPFAWGCDGEVYTAIDGYFVGRVMMSDSDAFRIVLRTDPSREVLVENAAGDRYVIRGTIVSQGVAAPEGDIADWGRFNFRIFDLDGGRPVAVTSAYAVGAGGDAFEFVRVNGTCESIQP